MKAWSRVAVAGAVIALLSLFVAWTRFAFSAAAAPSPAAPTTAAPMPDASAELAHGDRQVESPDPPPARAAVPGLRAMYSVVTAGGDVGIVAAEVWVGRMQGRRGIGTVLGRTGPSGVLEVPWSGDPEAVYWAVHGGVTAQFASAGMGADGVRRYTARVALAGAFTLAVVDESGQPVPDAKVVLSPRPIDPKSAFDWSDTAQSLVDFPGTGGDREVVLMTDDSGTVAWHDAAARQVYWAVSKPGFLAWGNDILPVLQVPGHHRIRLVRALWAGIKVRGDQLVTHHFVHVGDSIQDAGPGYVSLTNHVAQLVDADLVYVVPYREDLLGRNVPVGLYLRHAGAVSASMRLQPVEARMVPHFVDAGVADLARVASAQLRVRLRDPGGEPVTEFGWSVEKLPRGAPRSSFGVDGFEGAPGSYRVRLLGQVVEGMVGHQDVTLPAGGDEVVEFQLPQSLVCCEILFDLGKGPAAHHDFTLSLSPAGRAAGSRGSAVHGGASTLGNRWWLLPGRYDFKLWLPGCHNLVGQVDVPLGIASRDRPVRLLFHPHPL